MLKQGDVSTCPDGALMGSFVLSYPYLIKPLRIFWELAILRSSAVRVYIPQYLEGPQIP